MCGHFVREKKDLELKVERLESSADESRLLVETLRRDMTILKDTNALLQVGLGSC